MLHFLSIGLILGISAGLAPGPLLTLVIAESLQHGIRAGVKVALAPLITDLPIILVTLVIVSRLVAFQSALGIISLAGGLFLLFSGYQNIRGQGAEATSPATPSPSLLKGIMANALNPHPYLFWISVGAPTMAKAATLGVTALAAFIGGFYVALLGAKLLLAMIVGTYRSFLSGAVYRCTLRLLGLLLWAFAGLLLRDGAQMLGLF